MESPRRAAPRGQIVGESMFRTPMANLFMSIAAKEDIARDSFADSTGRLEI